LSLKRIRIINNKMLNFKLILSLFLLYICYIGFIVYIIFNMRKMNQYFNTFQNNLVDNMNNNTNIIQLENEFNLETNEYVMYHLIHQM
jgi:hypothetical protein